MHFRRHAVYGKPMKNISIHMFKLLFNQKHFAYHVVSLFQKFTFTVILPHRTILYCNIYGYKNHEFPKYTDSLYQVQYPWGPTWSVPITQLKLVPRYIRHTHIYNTTSLVYSLLYMKQMFLYQFSL